MKVFSLITSPVKNGNASAILKSIRKGIVENGGENEILFLDDYEVNHCRACNSCRVGRRCVQEDDFEFLVDKIRDSDLFIFTAPIYFSSMAGHSKVFLDRMLSIGGDVDQNFENTNIIVIYTHAAEDGHYKKYCQETQKLYEKFGFDVKYVIEVPDLVEDDSAASNKEMLTKFEDLGRSIVQ